MDTKARAGFTLLETIVALTLFAGVLLSLIGTGQLVLAHLYDSDTRLRVAHYFESVVDSLRGTACARLTSGTGARGSLAASWIITDLPDIAQLDVSIVAPRRRGAPALRTMRTLLPCPEA
jgi:prepilin-type N-terminal cleavage/methylation domain-containing protein